MKKSNLLALALAFCMIASFIPAPVASAADADVLYPMIVDLAGGTGVQLTSVSENLPTVSANGFEVDFSKSAAQAITWNSTGFNLRLVSNAANSQYVTFTVKAPAGEYAVFVEGVNQTVDITVGNEDAVKVVGTAGLDKVLDSVVLDNTGSVNVKFQNNTYSPENTNGTYNVLISKIIFVPTGAVNARLYGGGVAESVNFTIWGLNSKPTQHLSYFLSYEEHGCEYNLSNSSTGSDANHQYKPEYMRYRVKKSTNDIATAFNVLVPKSGEYTVTFFTAGQENAVPLDIYVGNIKAGTVNAASASTHAFETPIELTEGENVVKIVASNTTGTDSINYLVGFTLTPVVEEEPEPENPPVVIPDSTIFGDTYAYVEDGKLFFVGGLKTLGDYTKVGFEVWVGDDQMDDIFTTQVYKSFKIGENTYTAEGDFGATTDGYIFITEFGEIPDEGTITIRPYVAKGTAKTYHAEDLYLKLEI